MEQNAIVEAFLKNNCPRPIILQFLQFLQALPPPNNCEIGGQSPPMKFEMGVPGGGGQIWPPLENIGLRVWNDPGIIRYH